MKRLVLLLFCLCCFCLTGCTQWSDIPKGYTDKAEYFDPDGFQDYTDYCWYEYDRNPVQEDPRYHIVTESDVEEVQGYFANFRSWMEAGGRLDEYDFDDACISAGDYVRIVTNGRDRYADYDVYFYDAESGVLYYIHSNI